SIRFRPRGRSLQTSIRQRGRSPRNLGALSDVGRRRRSMKRVLVISPHPDDESIGCGGTVRKHVEEGATVRAIFLTSGEKGGHGQGEQATADIREAEARAAATILGIEHVE